jgi:uncharacterized protein
MKNCFRKPGIIAVIAAALLCNHAKVHGQKTGLEYFRLDQVKLLESPFHKAQQIDLAYIQEMDADRLLAPYMKAAGLEWPAENYGNWENTGLDGHIGGHYLSALAMMSAATGDDRIRERMSYMLDHLEQAQLTHGNGYLGGVPGGYTMWEEIGRGKIDAGNFSLNGHWVPLYNIHKIFAGLRDAYMIGGSEKAKKMLFDLCDWFEKLTGNFTDEQFQVMLQSEHGGLNEVFAQVAEISGEEK